MQLLVREIRKDSGHPFVQRYLGSIVYNGAEVGRFIAVGIYRVVCKNLSGMLLSDDLTGSVWRVGI